MRNSADATPLLQSGGFSLHFYVGRLFKVGFVGQCFILAALVAISFLVASTVDGSLILEGRNVGLLEHPAIWAFLVLQIALPLCIRRSIKKLQGTRLRGGEMMRLDGRCSDLILAPVGRFLRLRGKESRVVATLIYCAGLSAFVWNTYQNQRPGLVVPYDFWDSRTYFWGFWITRVYKLYLFAWLLPYLAMLQAAILVVTLRFVRRVRRAGRLKLLPFHSDGVGGLGFVASLVSTPVIITLVIGAIPTAAAFEVHRAPDVTPLIGLAALVSWSVIAYIVPIFFLRSDIVAMKRETFKRLATLEQANYLQLIKDKALDFERLRRGNEALDYFDKVCGKVRAIPNYPHLKRLVSSVGLAMTPSIISIAIKLYLGAAPIIGPVLGKP